MASARRAGARARCVPLPVLASAVVWARSFTALIRFGCPFVPEKRLDTRAMTGAGDIADGLRLRIHVAHCPPDTSKNKIECQSYIECYISTALENTPGRIFEKHTTN